MSVAANIDLSKLPAPQIVRKIDAEQIWQEVKADLIAQIPALESLLDAEGQLVTELGQAFADREMRLRAEFNDRAKGNLLALSTGTDLEHLAAFYGVARLVIQQADPQASPPIAEILETDVAMRVRTQLAMEGFSAAGPRGAYEFHARSADGRVKDVSVTRPTAGTVQVTILSSEGDGTPPSDLLTAVSNALNDEDVRPLCDNVLVLAPEILSYTVQAELTLYNGPDEAVVIAAAQQAVNDLVARLHSVGHDITLSALYGALHQPGVQKVRIVSPTMDIVVNDNQAAYCTQAPTITVVGRDV